MTILHVGRNLFGSRDILMSPTPEIIGEKSCIYSYQYVIQRYKNACLPVPYIDGQFFFMVENIIF